MFSEPTRATCNAFTFQYPRSRWHSLTLRNWRSTSHLADAALLVVPTVSFVSVILWFTQNPISPSASVEASVANPLGFLSSNFVYDGFINIENIVTSSVFLLIVSAFYPRTIRIVVVYLLPIVALGAGILAEITAVSSPLVNLHFCTAPCSFYGMSGVASGTIGFTVACFLISFGIIIARKWRGPRKSDLGLGGIVVPRNQAILVFGFIVYLVFLLLFSGVLAYPVQVAVHASQGGSSGAPPPPAILVQTPPVAFVHSASLVYGFLLCASILVRVGRRYRVF